MDICDHVSVKIDWAPATRSSTTSRYIIWSGVRYFMLCLNKYRIAQIFGRCALRRNIIPVGQFGPFVVGRVLLNTHHICVRVLYKLCNWLSLFWCYECLNIERHYSKLSGSCRCGSGGKDRWYCGLNWHLLWGGECYCRLNCDIWGTPTALYLTIYPALHFARWLTVWFSRSFTGHLAWFAIGLARRLTRHFTVWSTRRLTVWSARRLTRHFTQWFATTCYSWHLYINIKGRTIDFCKRRKMTAILYLVIHTYYTNDTNDTT